MAKVRVTFKATKSLPRIHFGGGWLSDGDIVEVDQARGEKIVKDFPDNFEFAHQSKSVKGAKSDKMLRGAKSDK